MANKIGEVRNPDVCCGFCGKRNEEVGGLITSPKTDISICGVCAKTSAAVFFRKEDLEQQAIKSANDAKANGTYVEGGPDCSCPACEVNRLIRNDTELRRIAVFQNAYMAMEEVPSGATIN